MRRHTLEQLPHNAADIRGTFSGVTETGILFEVRNIVAKRRMNSGEIIKSMIAANARARPVTSMYVDEQNLHLLVQGRPRIDIEQLPSRMYRYGHRIDRSLRNLVVQLMEDMGLELTPPAPRP